MEAQQISPQVVTKIIQCESEWDAIRTDWDTLYACSPTASTPLDFAWLRTWWRVYKPTFPFCELKVVTIWRGTQLIGALPLYIHHKKLGPVRIRYLGLLSTGEAEFEETCSDYLNLLHNPGEGVICVDSAWQAIKSMDWDHLEFLDLPEDTPLLTSRSIPKEATRFARGKCPVADLTGGFEAYLQRLSPNRRQQARRLIRAAERAGAVFEVVVADHVIGAYDDLVRLHQERWNHDGKPGVFGAPRFVEFHREMISQWIPAKRAVLARLSLPTSPVAILYGFVTGKKFDFYQSGVTVVPMGILHSPGNLAHLLLMKALTAQGVTAYDFLRGESSHKERHATRRNELVGIQIWRPTLRAVLYRLALAADRIVRKGFRIIS